MNLGISFAHQTFAWGSDAKGKAHVHVVIIGLAKRKDAPKQKRLFSYESINGDPHESKHTALSPYLFDAVPASPTRMLWCETTKPLNGFPKLIMGSQPIDDGNYIFKGSEKDEFLAGEPGATKFLHP